MGFTWTIITLVIALGITWRYLGSYMAAVFDGRVHFLAWAERPVYRALGTGPEHEQTWKRYAGSIVVFSAVALGLTYLIIGSRDRCPSTPSTSGAVSPALSFNTAASFMTNTNWQNYGGETTMSYFSQIGALTVAAVPEPGHRHRRGHRLGAGLLPSQLGDHRELLGRHDPVPALHPLPHRVRGGHHLRRPGRGADPGRPDQRPQLLERGRPRRSLEARSASWKPSSSSAPTVAGSSNANSATTFENPTALTNWFSIYLLLAIPFALTYTFGKMVGSVRHGVALLAAMVIIFGSWVGFTAYAEHQNNPAVAAAGVHSTVGNTEGKEVRFGDTTTALFGVASTQTSTGSADASYDSFNPMGGFGAADRHDAGRGDPRWRRERALHHLDLRHHRRVHRRADDRSNTRVPGQEDPGEGGEAGRPGRTGDAHHRARLHRHRRLDPRRAGRPAQPGPHGFTEILYALTSQGNNNGSAFGGLTGNTAFYNVIGAIDMLLGRFGDHDPGPGPGRLAGRQERGPGLARHVPHRQRHVRRA